MAQITDKQCDDMIAICDRVLERYEQSRKTILEGLAGLQSALDKIIADCKPPEQKQ